MLCVGGRLESRDDTIIIWVSRDGRTGAQVGFFHHRETEKDLKQIGGPSENVCSWLCVRKLLLARRPCGTQQQWFIAHTVSA